jgi:hypothetical protein
VASGGRAPGTRSLARLGVPLTITETLLTFVGIPGAVVACVYGLVYAGSAARGKRYRPGRPYAPSAVWFVANKPGAAAAGHASAHAVTAAPARPAVGGGAGSHESLGDEVPTVGYGETGGAHDSW